MFNRIIYINLDRRPDRNTNIIDQLKKINYQGDVVRMPGVDWKNINFDTLSHSLFTPTALATALDDSKPLYSPMTKGGIGCAMAHRNTYEHIYNSDVDYTLILEDDVTLDDNFLDKLNIYLNDLPSDYDILWLGYHYKNNKAILSNSFFDIPGNVLFGLFGYIINKKAAEKLLNIFPITYQIDSEIPHIFSELKVYAIKEQYMLVNSPQSSEHTIFGTDIQIRGKDNIEGFTTIQNNTDYLNNLFLCKNKETIKYNVENYYFLLIIIFLILMLIKTYLIN